VIINTFTKRAEHISFPKECTVQFFRSFFKPQCTLNSDESDADTRFFGHRIVMFLHFATSSRNCFYSKSISLGGSDLISHGNEE
jgi:hypothetical protein